MQNPLSSLPRIKVSRTGRILVTAFASAMAMTGLVQPTENAIANGETRSLSMRHLHTGETINITYKRDGRYDPDALKKLNWFLRDWRRDEPTRMDPRLFDTVWLAYHAVGATQPINVVCGYRSPETNGMLRRRSRGVAKFSQHTLGKAMDFFIPGVPLSKLRVAGLRLQRGGVGFYPTSGSPFVHMDAGGVRMWPRMTRGELASVFPDGKTVLIPADGRPMPGYQVAMNEILRKGGTVGGRQGSGDDDGGGSDSAEDSGGGFFASLFGHRSSQSPADTMMEASRGSHGGMVTAPAGKPVAAPTVLAMARPAEAEPPEPQQRMAAIPLPERRPADIDAGTDMADAADGASADVAANVPLPPIRPDGRNDAAPAPQQVVASLDAPVAASDTEAAPPPLAMPARPASLAPASASQPLPAHPASASATLQPRPAIFADLSKGSEGFMKRGTARQPQRALGFADASPVALRAAAHAPRPMLTATRFEKLNFASLSAPVSSAHNKQQAQLVKPDLNTTASLIAVPSRTVLIKFGVAAYQDLRAEKFSGQAVKPLRVASFSSMPDIFTGSIAASN